MLLNKRSRKAPDVYIPVSIQKEVFEKPIEKKRRINCCQYHNIIYPTKFDEINDNLLLFGNIPLTQKEGKYFTDFALLNEFHSYKYIEIEENDSNKNSGRLLHIYTERRTDVSFPRWKTTSKKLVKSKDLESKYLGKSMKSYSLAYEKAANDYMNEINVDNVNEIVPNQPKSSDKTLMENSSLEKNDKILAKCPFFQLRTQFRGFENRLVEIVLNEMFLEVLGYSTEDFIHLVLKEGLPQFIPLSTEDNSNFIKQLLDECSKINTRDFRSEELETVLLTSTGFKKQVKLQASINMNYNEEKFGSDLTFILKAQKPPSSLIDEEQTFKIKQNYFDLIVNREKELSNFMSLYQKDLIFPKYMNIHRTCRLREVKELSPD